MRPRSTATMARTWVCPLRSRSVPPVPMPRAPARSPSSFGIGQRLNEVGALVVTASKTWD